MKKENLKIRGEANQRQKVAAKNAGITLVALVVTIIVLLILSGITINMLFNDNGIITKAQKAAEATKKSEVQTYVQLDLLALQQEAALGEGGDLTVEQVEGVLVKYGTVNKDAEGNIVSLTTKDGELEIAIEDLYGGTISNGSKWSYASDRTEVTNGKITLKIGDYVNYDCKTGATTASYTSPKAKNGKADQTSTLAEYNYGWRVLGVDDKQQLEIVAEDFAPITGGNTANGRGYMYLEGQAGYVNGEEEVNNISKIYGQGKGAAGARSIKVEDVNGLTGYNPNNIGVRDPEQTGNGTKHEAGKVWEYGNEVTYARPTSSTVSYNGTNGKTGTGSWSQFTYYNGNSWISLGENDGSQAKLKSTDYGYYPQTLTLTDTPTATTGIATSSTIYKMLFTNSSTGANSANANATDGFYYWLGSSYVRTNAGIAAFGVRIVSSGYVDFFNLCDSDGHAILGSFGVRPVVSLESKVQLEKAGSQKDSCDVWNIK